MSASTSSLSEKSSLRNLVILDLDGVGVEHGLSSFYLQARFLTESTPRLTTGKTLPPHGLNYDHSDFSVEGLNKVIFVKLREGLMEFLHALLSKYDIAVWTSGNKVGMSKTVAEMVKRSYC
jgi:NLI interacting factor-like phosphatase.